MVFSEMSLSAAAPEDVPDTYFVGVGVSEHRQSVGHLDRGGQPCATPRAPVRKSRPRIRVFFVRLLDSDAFLEVCIFGKAPIEGPSWP